MSKLVLKICCGTWENASRDKRELSACRELGLQTLVMAKGEPKDKYRKDTVGGFDVVRFSTRPLGTQIPNGVNRAVALFTWTHYARKLKPDIISGHDLTALLIGWMSNIFRSRKATLIYDSHEFEIGRNVKRNKLQLWRVTHMERFLMKRCAFSIMVNDAIADEVQRIHKLEKRPIVVRSTPNLWTVDPAVCAKKREELLAAFGEYCEFLMMFHGNLGVGNGIETLIPLLDQIDGLGLICLGKQTSTEVKTQLDELIAKYAVGNRVLLMDAVPIEELWQYVGAVDAEMMLIEPIVRSHYFVLPNKFFESIQSLTPIIASDMPEMKKLINKYQIGLTCPPNDIEAAFKCVERMRTDKAFYAQCKKNLKIAKQELCWEKEKEELKEAYQKVI